MATSTLGSGTLVLAGTTSGTTTVTATAVAGTTTLTLPAATDTLVGKATTDTLTNKTLTGAAMNGTVGATTPSTGAFTTLSSTGNVTVGNTSGERIVSIISTDNNSFYKVAPGNGATGGYRFNNSAGTQHWNIFETTGASGQQGALGIYNEVGASQVLTLDTSGNLGIGTTSPNSRLQVSNSTVSTNAIAQFTNGTTGTGAGNGLYVGIDSTNEATVFNFHNSPIKFGTNGTERARFNSTGALVFAGGTTTANGIGITFPATQSASTDANTLDDYEEGTWTPSLGGNTTYLRQQGTYTKIGRIVYITGRIDLTSLGTGSNSTISGLPFTSIAAFQEQGLSVGYFGDLAVNTTFLAPRVISNSTTINAVGIASSGATMSALNIFGNSTVLIFTGCYEIA